MAILQVSSPFIIPKKEGECRIESNEEVGEENVEVVIGFSMFALEKKARKEPRGAWYLPPKRTDHRMS